MTRSSDYKPIVWDNFEFAPLEPKLKCKHGKLHQCDKCGVNSLTDELHTTVDGTGKVGKLMKK